MNHNHFMQLALDFAEKGKGYVAPNPLVGCVIVRNNEMVASGYHKKYGDAHAEVNAITNLHDTVSPKECTLYVTLEPCSHFGKTPPCADLIIKKGFKRVVIACKDPNPLVAGNGIKKLIEAGIEVICGVMEKEARELNKHFVHFFENKRPYFLLKWAQTADGFISKWPIPENKEENKISGHAAQTMVHALRAEYMAIMVGKNTVLSDNPSLTTRLVNGKNPIRIFIDKNLEVPASFAIYDASAQTIVFNALKDSVENNIQFIKLNFNEAILPQISSKLYQLNIQSVLVEGGAQLLNTFINQGLWDELMVFENTKLRFGKGIKAPFITLENTFEPIGNDKLFRVFKSKNT